MMVNTMYGGRNQLREIDHPKQGTILNLFWAPDDTSIVVATSLGLWFYPSDLTLPTRNLPFAQEASAVVFDPVWSKVATAELDGIAIYDVETGQLLRHWTAEVIYNALAFDTAGDRLAAAVNTDQLRTQNPGTIIHIFSLNSGNDQPIQIFDDLNRFPARGLAFSPDGSLLAVNALDTFVEYPIWEFYLLDPATGTVLTTLTEWSNIPSNGYQLADASCVVAPYSAVYLVQFDPQPERFGFRLLKPEETQWVLAVELNYKVLAVEDDFSTILKSIHTGKTLAQFPKASRAAFSPHGNHLALYTDADRLAIYDLELNDKDI
jgi:WD40 repeat protein